MDRKSEFPNLLELLKQKIEKCHQKAAQANDEIQAAHYNGKAEGLFVAVAELESELFLLEQKKDRS